MRQLSQRISARFHLRPLNVRETAAYIRHRLAVSGAADSLFSRLAVGEIHRRSGGIPRLINLICDRALLGAYSLGKPSVSFVIARKAARELMPKRGIGVSVRSSAATPLAVLAVLSVAGSLYAGYALRSAPAAVPRQLSTLWNPLATDDPSKPDAPSFSAQVAAPAKSADTVPIVTAEAEPSFSELIADPGLTRDKAFASLLSLWRIDLPDGTSDPCRVAEQKGLRCLPINGNWFQLRNLDHPAVLEFATPDGAKRYAAIVGIRDEKIELSLGERKRTFGLADILPFWRGSAIVLWKPPGGDAPALAMGSKGETVRWLRHVLRAPAQDGADDYFDASLRDRVIAFQAEHGLAPDGVAGPYTMVHLAKRADDSGVPRLSSRSH